MNIYNVILGPVESHKSRTLETTNVYTFRVSPDASKTDIKNAFQSLYDRQVSSVQIAKNHLKVRNGKKGKISRRSVVKKAYVRLDKPITQLAKLHLSKD